MLYPGHEGRHKMGTNETIGSGYENAFVLNIHREGKEERGEKSARPSELSWPPCDKPLSVSGLRKCNVYPAGRNCSLRFSNSSTARM